MTTTLDELERRAYITGDQKVLDAIATTEGNLHAGDWLNGDEADDLRREVESAQEETYGAENDRTALLHGLEDLTDALGNADLEAPTREMLGALSLAVAKFVGDYEGRVDLQLALRTCFKTEKAR